MTSWDDADSDDKILLRALSLLYGKNKKLLNYILDPNMPRLRTSSRSIKEVSASLSSGEDLLIRIGLDAWDESGGIHFNELYEKLDPSSFQKVLLFLNYLYSPNEATNIF